MKWPQKNGNASKGSYLVARFGLSYLHWLSGALNGCHSLHPWHFARFVIVFSQFSAFIPVLPEIFNVGFLRLSVFASVRVLFNRFILERTLFFGKNKSDLNNFWSGNLAEREDWQAWTSAESSRWRTRCAAASPRSRTHWKLSIPSRRQRNTFTRTGRWHKWLNSKRCRGSMPP